MAWTLRVGWRPESSSTRSVSSYCSPVVVPRNSVRDPDGQRPLQHVRGTKIWSHIGLVFATIYAVLISINYYVQLTFVVPRLLQEMWMDSISLQPFLFVPFDSFLYSVDILGYSFMSLATLFAAFAFTGKGIDEPFDGS